MTGLERYRATVRQRDAVRAAACGDLSEALESAFVAELDEIWWTLTDAEQRAIDGNRCTVEGESLCS